MNNIQQQHLTRLVDSATATIKAKYIKGAKEHKGDLLSLSPLQLCDEAIQECTDQYIYLMTLRELLVNRNSGSVC